MTTHSARRINKLASALQAKTYLEIGVYEGETFLDVTIEKKLAVDPRKRFTYEGVGSHTFRECTSDAFFASWSSGEAFDIVFLDGFHTFEQTFRDFCNAVTLSHQKTCILIDDVWPTDVYSSLADMHKAKQYRKELSTSESQAWHGDVFKTVFAIGDCFATLNFRTIFGSGNAQTLVWRSVHGHRPQRFKNLEAVSRMSYFDLLEHRDGLRPATEDDAIALCLHELGATG